MHPLFGRKIELVGGFNSEGLVPRVEVPDDAVDPVDRRAVFVGQQLLAERALALLGLPAVDVGDK